MDRDAAERSHIYQLQSSDAWQVWKQKPAHEKQDGRLVSDFVDDLNPRVISPLKMQVKTVLKETRSQIQHLSVLEDMLSAREQIIFLRRLEELDADRRKAESAKATVIQAKEQLLSGYNDQKIQLKTAYSLKADTEERLRKLEDEHRNLEDNYGDLHDIWIKQTQKLEKTEKRRNKLAKKLEDAQERLDKDEGTRECVICLDAKITMAFMPCGHMCVCKECAEKYIHAAPCPICRKPVGSYVEIFMS